MAECVAPEGARAHIAEVKLPTPRDEDEDLSRAPRMGIRLMIIMLIAFGLLSIYANVQKGRRHQIETVTITRATSPTPGGVSH